MPAKDLLAAQRLTYEVGRIRTGVRVPTGRTDDQGRPIERPETIDTLRFTSANKHVVEEAARFYGGEARPWDNRGHKEWEVITQATELLVTVPPDAEAISMWYEMWAGGRCLRRCDSERDFKTGRPCECAPLLEKFDPEDRGRERSRLAKLRKPQACALQTRVALILPDLPDIGYWRLDTKSYYGAEGLLGKARIMEMARAQGIYLPARLWIDHQVDVDGEGKTRHYPVPQISLLNTTREIATGELAARGIEAQLPPPPGAALAIGGAPRAAIGAPAPAPAPSPNAPEAPAREAERPADHQAIADAALAARTRARLRPLFRQAKAAEEAEPGFLERQVRVDEAGDVWDTLQSCLDGRWAELPDDQAPPRQQAAPQQRGGAGGPEASGSLFDEDSWPAGEPQ